MVMSARPSPRRRTDARARTTATAAATTAPMSPPTSKLKPEVVGELRRGEGPDPGQRRLGQRELTAHAGDQGDREEDGREHQPGVEHVLPGRRQPGQHRHDEAAEQHVPGDRIIRSIWGARRERTVGGGGGSTEESGSLVRSRLRRPGTNSRAATRTMKGSDVNSGRGPHAVDRQVALEHGGRPPPSAPRPVRRWASSAARPRRRRQRRPPSGRRSRRTGAARRSEPAAPRPARP